MKYLQILTLACCLMLLHLQLHAQTRSVRSFHGVHIGGSLDVILERGNRESVHFDLKNIDDDDITTEVENGILKIREKNRGWNWKNVSGKIYVTYRSIDELYVSGSGDVICRDRISGRDVNIRCSGSGNLEAQDIDADQFTASLSGSGNLYLAGETGRQSLKISGSGNIKAEDLRSDETEAHISGSGNISVTAYEVLDARISGSGNIRYKGNAPRIYSKTSGSGSISRINR